MVFHSQDYMEELPYVYVEQNRSEIAHLGRLKNTYGRRLLRTMKEKLGIQISKLSSLIGFLPSHAPNAKWLFSRHTAIISARQPLLPLLTQN